MLSSLLLSYRKLMLLAFVLTTAFTVSAATGSIQFLRFDHNVNYNGQSCLGVHFKVQVAGMKGRDIKIIMYVEHPKGVGVPDKNNNYCTKDGKVCASGSSNATYDDSIWRDWVIYLPNSEIHPLPGNNTYYIEALVWDDNKNVIARTYCDPFDMEGSQESFHEPSHNHSIPDVSGGYTDNIKQTYREELGYGYKIVTLFNNGSRIEAFYYPCGMCGGRQTCMICGGRGGIISAGYGTYIPCAACGQTGVCTQCREHHGYTLSMSQLYNSEGKPVYVPRPGRGSSGSSSGSSSGGGSSSRYGNRTCPVCHGSGTCQTCGGDGIADSYYTGGSMECPNCTNNRGRCRTCNGTGSVYGVK